MHRGLLMLKRSIDEWKQLLIGNTYNLLTVTDVVKVDSKMMSVCICKCGNIKYAEPFRVFHGNIKSCGCLNNSENLSSRHTERHRRKLEKLKDQLINMRSGSLVVQDVIINSNNSIMCICRCDCGVIKEIPPKSLKRGIKSCGCRSSVNPRADLEDLKKEYIGLKIDHLLVVDVVRIEVSNTKVISFVCKCDCGSTATIPKKKLLSNSHPISCGCCRRKCQYYNEYRTILSRKISEFYKNNPDKSKIRSNNSRISWLKNRDKNRELLLNAHSNKRIEVLNKIDTSFIHPDDVVVLKSGVRSDIKIRTKCPVCGKYDYHTTYHIINYEALATCQRMCSCCSKSFSTSKYEQEIADYISTFYDGECIRNDRLVLNGKELDLYYPEKKIAIEFNGDYWHNESHQSRDYHYNKYIACRDLNITLVSIFESDWNRRKKDIKEYILDLFSGIENKLSFNEDHTLMNNNYPLPSYKYNDSDNFIEHYYITRESKVYTCGYSTIIPDIKLK